MTKSKLIIRFPNQSTSFTYGVEFGRLLEKMERSENIIMNNGFPVRIENKELIKDSCNHYGYTALFGQEYEHEWVEFVGIKRNNN